MPSHSDCSTLPAPPEGFQRSKCKATSTAGQRLCAAPGSCMQQKIVVISAFYPARTTWSKCWKSCAGCSGWRLSNGIWSGCVPIGTAGATSVPGLAWAEPLRGNCGKSVSNCCQTGSIKSSQALGNSCAESQKFQDHGASSVTLAPLVPPLARLSF